MTRRESRLHVVQPPALVEAPDVLTARLSREYAAENKRCPDNRPSKRWAYRHLLKYIAGADRLSVQITMASAATNTLPADVEFARVSGKSEVRQWT